MGNYNIIVDTSNFKPFDYSLALLTMRDYGTAYQRLAEQMNKIAEDKGLYILPDTPEYKLYRDVMDRYNTDFNTIAEDFNRKMDANNVRLILGLRRRYFNDVAPINKAIEAYNKDQDKIIALGDDAIVGNRNRTITDYYGGLNPGIDYRSSKTIQLTAANVVRGMDNALMLAPEIAGNIAKLYFVLKQRGLNSNDALAKILKNSNFNSRLDIANAGLLIQALDRIYQLYAFADGTPENNKVWENVITGAIQGILAPKYTTELNRGYLNDKETLQVEDEKEYKKLMRSLLLLKLIVEMEEKGYIYDPSAPEGQQWKYSPEEALKHSRIRKGQDPDNPDSPTDTHLTATLSIFKDPDTGKEYIITMSADGRKIVNAREKNTGIMAPDWIVQRIEEQRRGNNATPTEKPPINGLEKVIGGRDVSAEPPVERKDSISQDTKKIGSK